MQLPEAFIIRTKSKLGDEWAAFEQALKEESPVSIRLNPKKISKELLSVDLPLSEPVPWAKDGYYLDNRPSFTMDPLFHAGCYYVQEASSMILEHFFRNYFPNPVKVLDLCAAPGGKSTHLSSLLRDDCLLVANEVIRSRANILSENLIKWGNPNTIVTNSDPVEIGKSLPGYFDIIVADLPCSGEGMFRKDQAAIAEWSLNNVRHCAERQRRIVADVWPALKQDGIFIYSTCTYNSEENEENIDWICREFDAELLEEPRRLMPHYVRGEGFFIAGIRKGEWRRAKSEWQKAKHHSDYLQIKNKLKIIFAGFALGEVIGQDRISAHALAMSNTISDSAFPRWDVDKERALNYLRKEVLQDIPGEIPKGYVLITYKGHALGFVKNIGTRANNLYPQEFRIRKNILPLTNKKINSET